ncbi:hypothetical protein JHK87_006982 [Glycine soja]|nr:hypothetical protein JHK87_006982 [Glycine soja]
MGAQAQTDEERGARQTEEDGAFDLFHAGHVEILRLARDLGDFLLVGIHTDQTVRLVDAIYVGWDSANGITCSGSELYKGTGFVEEIIYFL